MNRVALNTFVGLWMLITLVVSNVALGQGPVPPFSDQPLTPLYAAHAPQSTDHFYTVNPAEHQIALGIGFQDQGVVAYLESGPAPNTAPFKRFYSATRTDHFYTTSSQEEAYVLANGWQYENVEGYIYLTQVPGSIPLYRLGRSNPSTGDHDHIWTVNAYDVYYYTVYQGYLGWAYDGVAGYVYSNALPTVENGHIFGTRTWLPGPIRSKSFGDLVIPSTDRVLKNTSRQVVSFALTSYGMQASGEHFGVMLRASFSETGWLQNNYYYWGAGTAIGRMDRWCGGTALQAAIQVFDPPGGVYGSEAGSLIPNSCSAPMQDGVRYDVVVTYSDAAQVDYVIRQNSTIVGSGSAYIGNLSGYSPFGGYKLNSTGVVIIPVTGGTSSYTAYIENLSIRWE